MTKQAVIRLIMTVFLTLRVILILVNKRFFARNQMKLMYY